MQLFRSRRAFGTGLTVLAMLGWSAPQAQEVGDGRSVDLLLVLAVDVSESISEREAWLQRMGYADALVDPGVVAAIKSGRHGRIAVTYMEWAGPGEQRQVIGWTRISDDKDARILGESLKSAPVSGGYWTSMSGALNFALNLMGTSPFDAERRVIDLSSDGRNNAGAPLADARRRVLAQGITINGLPVMAMRRNFTWPPIPNLDRYFTDCVIGGPAAFSITVENFKDFARAVRRKLIREIAYSPAGEKRVRPVAEKREDGKYDCREDPQRAGALPQAG